MTCQLDFQLPELEIKLPLVPNSAKNSVQCFIFTLGPGPCFILLCICPNTEYCDGHIKHLSVTSQNLPSEIKHSHKHRPHQLTGGANVTGNALPALSQNASPKGIQGEPLGTTPIT